MKYSRGGQYVIERTPASTNAKGSCSSFVSAGRLDKIIEGNNLAFLKKQKKRRKLSSKKKRLKPYLEWSNLLLDKCPACGESWSLGLDGFFRCKKHQYDFKICEAKVISLKLSLDKPNYNTT